MRKRIYEIVESGGEDRVAVTYDAAMIVLIVASLIPLAFKNETPFLKTLDIGCALVFLADYCLRWITADYKYGSGSVMSFVRYPFSFMAVIDLLSILPSFSFLNGAFKVLRVTRIFRALRVLRVFKAVRYSRNVKIVLRVLEKSKSALAAVGSMALIYIFICALVILNIEPDTFDSFFDAVYWATISLTTLGYGDIYPVSEVGRFFTMISAILGIAIVALPSGIITAGFMSELEKEKIAQEEDSTASPPLS